ncbi:hypothetical protein J6590_089308 [Homalodisca vitripennis]|nr:hypothetical protein J6590_102951 [Homalodisca vitripennis]KAG8280113.1 hypothetical protein J6590_089308 [Homalodisca vitripennis]
MVVLESYRQLKRPALLATTKILNRSYEDTYHQSETCRQSVEDVTTTHISDSSYEAVQQSSFTLFQINQNGLVDQVDHCEVVEQLDNNDVAFEQPNIKESAANVSVLGIPILPIVKRERKT